MQLYLFPALFAFVLSFALCLAALKLFPKIGLMDRPEKYGLTRKPIPYYGGLVIFTVFVLSVVIFVPLNSHLIIVLIAATLLTIVSFLDDLFSLSPYFRLFIQIVCALFLIFSGIGIHTVSNFAGGSIMLDTWPIILNFGGVNMTIFIVSALITLGWIVAMINTVNWLDGLNGLPSGVSAIAALTLFFLSIRPDIHFDISSQVPVATMSIILFGCMLAFCLFDFYPAKMLMGDTGSMFLGFILATLAIFSGGKVATAFLVLGLPLLDFVWVILRRIFEGKSPFRGDLRHLHHRLVDAGLSHRQTLLLFYGISAAFGAIAVLLQGMQKFYAIVILCLFMLMVAVIAVYIQSKRRS